MIQNIHIMMQIGMDTYDINNQNVMVVNKNNRNHDNNNNNIHMQQNTQDFVLIKQEAKEQNNKNVTSLPKKRKSQFHIHNVSNK